LITLLSYAEYLEKSYCVNKNHIILLKKDEDLEILDNIILKKLFTYNNICYFQTNNFFVSLKL